MTFTDDDLKRLKEWATTVRYTPYEDAPELEFSCTAEEFLALLARLEAETNAADLLQLHYESGVFDDLDEGDVALIVQALEARRKAAGK